MHTGHSTFSIQVSAFPASREQKASPSHGPLPNSEVLPKPHLLLNVFWPPLSSDGPHPCKPCFAQRNIGQVT